MAVDTLGHLLALLVTPANEDDRSAVAALTEAMQDATNQSVDLAYVDQDHTGERPVEAAAKQGIALEVVRLPEAKRDFLLLPRRRVVERLFGWMDRSRRLARDYERLPDTLTGLHLVAFHPAAPTRRRPRSQCVTAFKRQSLPGCDRPWLSRRPPNDPPGPRPPGRPHRHAPA